MGLNKKINNQIGKMPKYKINQEAFDNQNIKKEDHYFSEILNDLNSPNGGVNVINDGNKMRSKAIQVLFKLDHSVVTLSLLQYVTCGFIDSPKNP